jgi:hypothetical protein
MHFSGFFNHLNYLSNNCMLFVALRFFFNYLLYSFEFMPSFELFSIVFPDSGYWEIITG